MKYVPTAENNKTSMHTWTFTDHV